MTYVQLAEDVIEGFGRVWIPTNGTLDDGQAQAPDIALDTVGSASTCSRLLHTPTCNALGGNVALTTNVCLGNTGNQIAAHTEIADLDLSARIDEDIRGLDIAMYDVVVVLEGPQAHDSG